MTDQRTRGAAILPRTVELNHVAAARFAHARYTILPNPSKEFLNCLYRDNIELLCPEGAEIISFDKVVNQGLRPHRNFVRRRRRRDTLVGLEARHRRWDEVRCGHCNAAKGTLGELQALARRGKSDLFEF